MPNLPGQLELVEPFPPVREDDLRHPAGVRGSGRVGRPVLHAFVFARNGEPAQGQSRPFTARPPPRIFLRSALDSSVPRSTIAA